MQQRADRTLKETTGQGETEGRREKGKARQGREGAEKGRTGQDRTGKGRTRQGKAGQSGVEGRRG